MSEASEDYGGTPIQSQLSLHLGQWEPNAKTSLANALRACAGGLLPPLPLSDDLFVRSLQVVARDMWPIFLLPPSDLTPSPFWNSMPMGIFDHPGLLVAASELLKDDSLRQLFPTAKSGSELTQDDLTEIKSWWVSSTGSGSSRQLNIFLGTLIANSRLYALVKSGDESWGAFTESIKHLVDDLRHLAEGERTNVPRLVGLRGAGIEQGLEIEFPTGKLCAPRPRDQGYLLPSQGQLTMVFITYFPLRLADIKPLDPTSLQNIGSAWDSLKEDAELAQKETDRVRLAALLASPDDHIWELSEGSSLTVDPTSIGGDTQWHLSNFGGSSGTLDKEAAEQIPFWRKEIEDKHPSELDIAMRRMLSAAGDRIDPVDAFVDAVIAWENCFGTSTETTFRVTAAIAALLEPNSLEDRLETHKELKKIYGKRSRVVHGSSQIDQSESNDLRDRALRVAIQTLQKLYQEHPDLLPLKSEERSTRLLLDP
jgi:hypothetical protein